MIFKQFEAKGLSHYSYAIGCKDEAEVIIVDPERDIQTYLEYAAEQRLKIKYVLETHVHADYASGAHELAIKTGAELRLSSYDTGEKFEYSFAHTPLKDGDEINTGKISLRTLHTPGHTPEHLSFLVFDKARSATEPLMMLSGDFLFVGSVGRPDLLGDADKRPLAKKLYQSLQEKVKPLHDSLEIYPAHGAGSLCGAGMGSAKHTTLGFEREANPYLQEMSEEAFVEKILANSPPFPDYYLRMKKINAEGPALLDGLPKPEAMDVATFKQAIEKKSVTIDLRHPLSYGGGHIENTLNIGMPDHTGVWASWLVPYDSTIYLVLEDGDDVRQHVQSLVRVGHDKIKGYLQPGFKNWANKGEDFTDLPQVSVHVLTDFIELGEKITLIDVRSEGEWNTGHAKEAKNIFLGNLPKNLKKLPKEEPIFCICGGGSRSSIAASLLMQNGFENVYNVFGGMSAWKAAGLPVVTEKVKERQAV